MTRRELAARRALDRLGLDRFLTFIRAVPGEYRPLAVDLMLQHIDGGESAESAFFDGAEYGYRLSIKGRGKNRFEILFGCIPAPDLGDLGEWIVEFNDDSTVRSIEGGMSLII